MSDLDPRCRLRPSRRVALAGLLIGVGLVAGVGGLPGASASPDDVVLGSADYLAPYAKGFGTKEPRRIYNGGATSGLVRKIHWRNWGSRTAKGIGRGYQYKPGGGYYSRSVRVKLRARRLGHCPGHPKRAYTRLRAKFQEKPGGDYGRWFSWAGSDDICDSG